jgi:hypothetical protein
MRKAYILPEERAEEAMAAGEALVALSTEQLETCQNLLNEMALTGELPTGLLKQLVRTQSEIRRVRTTLAHIAKDPPPA